MALSSEDNLLVRLLAIASGYEDAYDLDALRDDLGFHRVPAQFTEPGAGLESKPSLSGLENAPTTSELAKMAAVMTDIYCASQAPTRIVH